MFYKLLGMAVWHGGKLYLGRRYGPHAREKALAAGGALALGAGVLALALRRTGSDAG